MSEQEAESSAPARRIIRPTPEEDVAINAQIAADPDDFELDELISAWGIARMAEGSGDGTHDMSDSPPICPKHGRGEKMVLREGYTTFWGCPRYPTCRGTRNL